MKKFVLEEMSLLSAKEGRARKILFDENITVISGANSTGKSAIIKSIYWTFGAEPETFGDDWKNVDVTSLIKFSVDSKRYFIMRSGKLFSIFGQDGSLIGNYSSVTYELGPVLGKLFNFNLRLNNNDGKEIIPPPAYYLLPFYIDQDSGWNKAWSSFKNLGQIPSWNKDIVDYLIGVKTDRYYELQNIVKNIDARLAELDMERKYLSDSMSRLDIEESNIDSDINIDSFKEEIDRLIISLTKLKEIRESFRQEILEKTNTRYLITSQIKLVEASLGEIKSDYAYACNHEEVDCPTCGHAYFSTFSERFAIAQDEAKCKDLLLSLRNELGSINKEIESLKIEFSSKESEIVNLSAILSEKKGKVTLNEIIENEGKKQLSLILGNKVNLIHTEIGKIESDKNDRKEELKTLQKEDKKRKKQILDYYVNSFKSNVEDLEVVGLNESAYKSVYCKIHVSGSDKPRALLAYYYAVLGVIFNYSSCVFAPMIIDSPNQQDQDKENIENIFNFISKKKIEGTQLILAVTDLHNVICKGKNIVLKDKASAMTKEAYGVVSKEMQPFINKSLLLV